jgi:microcin C transport system substrate-binding protein
MDRQAERSKAMTAHHPQAPRHGRWLSPADLTVAALALFFVSFAASPPGFAAGPSHGLSAFDELKYPADFPHFDYVNPDAPKGGRLAMIGTAATVTFDSFNGFIRKACRRRASHICSTA